MTEPEGYKATYTFTLPEHADELKVFQSSSDYYLALTQIHDKCRTVWKYEESPSEDRVSLAEEISAMVTETGAMDL